MFKCFTHIDLNKALFWFAVALFAVALAVT
jgi:hypothetical protein